MKTITLVIGVFILFISGLSFFEYVWLSLAGVISGIALLIIAFNLFKSTSTRLAYYLSILSASSFFTLMISEIILVSRLTTDDVLVLSIFLLFFALLIKKHQPEKTWRWKKARVNTHEDYIELRYGNAESGSWDNWLPVARIAPAKHKTFKVDDLTQALDKNQQVAREAAIKEINFFLVEKGEPDPWAYAQYHCTTAANIYSNIHWAFFPARPMSTPA